MKKNIILSAIVMMFAVLTSCTHNNGDIGDMFGLWKVSSIQAEGSEENLAPNDLFMAFQNNVVKVRWAYGRWERNGNNLDLIFEMEPYTPPTNSFMVKGTNHCIIEKLNGSDFVFTNTVKNSEGEVTNYRYTLVHWN